MKNLYSSAALILMTPDIALADANCKINPKNAWKSEAAARAHFEGQSCGINKFKVSGNCYETYGLNAEGKKDEIYFDMKIHGRKWIDATGQGKSLSSETCT